MCLYIYLFFCNIKTGSLSGRENVRKGGPQPEFPDRRLVRALVGRGGRGRVGVARRRSGRLHVRQPRPQPGEVHGVS